MWIFSPPHFSFFVFVLTGYEIVDLDHLFSFHQTWLNVVAGLSHFMANYISLYCITTSS